MTRIDSVAYRVLARIDAAAWNMLIGLVVFCAGVTFGMWAGGLP